MFNHHIRPLFQKQHKDRNVGEPELQEGEHGSNDSLSSDVLFQPHTSA